jgi:hypothetical protein
MQCHVSAAISEQSGTRMRPEEHSQHMRMAVTCCVMQARVAPDIALQNIGIVCQQSLHCADMAAPCGTH